MLVHYTELLIVQFSAALNSGKELVHVLIRHKADVNAVDDKHKSALMLAVISGNAGSVQSLLDAKADISIKNKVRKTFY
jgi:ankyrin repeat protein